MQEYLQRCIGHMFEHLATYIVSTGGGVESRPDAGSQFWERFSFILEVLDCLSIVSALCKMCKDVESQDTHVQQVDISFVLLVGASGSMLFQNGNAMRFMMIRKLFKGFPGSREFKVGSYRTTTVVPRRLCDCKDGVQKRLCLWRIGYVSFNERHVFCFLSTDFAFLWQPQNRSFCFYPRLCSGNRMRGGVKNTCFEMLIGMLRSDRKNCQSRVTSSLKSYQFAFVKFHFGRPTVCSELQNDHCRGTGRCYK